jgi:hypothetical protein
VIVGQRRWPLDCFPPDLIRGSLAMTSRVGVIENCFSARAYPRGRNPTRLTQGEITLSVTELRGSAR